MVFEELWSSFSSAHLWSLAGLLAAYALYGAFWRLYLSPVAHIPGPKLAALTWWYEFYYDIVLGGQYVFKIIELHDKYGPIIRINPDEVHIGDPDFYEELYPSANRRRDRPRFFTKQFGADESSVGTAEHDLHRVRKTALNHFFSTQSVRNLQPIIEERVNALLARFSDHATRSSDQPLDVLYPFSAFTNDVICEYSFAKSDHLTEEPDYGKDVTDALLTGTHYGKWIQHAEIILKLINALPESLSGRFIPGWRGFLKMKNDILHQISDIKATEKTPRWQLDTSHPTIFHELLSSPILPPDEKTPRRLAQEGQVLVQAGTLTTSWALALTTFHLLNRPSTLRLLRDELVAGIPDPNAVVPLPDLEQMPYLRAVVKETLRLSLGTSGRLARVCPDETLIYTDSTTDNQKPKAYTIPSGVPVGMTTYQTVTNPALYPDPFAFKPERWLGPEAERAENYLTVFGGGRRVCLGKALSQAELYLALAKMWRVWGGESDQRAGDRGVVRLFETEERDTRMAADYFIPIPWTGTKGIRVVLEGK
ncbi:cytochrome P450 CYP542B3 [Cercophora scortea]|uniref:Cytochrome P450 CYP542B3 n=1 Tax=Cercophora scortea TaxID=314031 RepID=A0AAE0J3G1_9PEZI|nr:cytochrome P450 CYP542B3 [Cercophora scortea]